MRIPCATRNTQHLVLFKEKQLSAAVLGSWHPLCISKQATTTSGWRALKRFLQNESTGNQIAPLARSFSTLVAALDDI
jgi:hypothetical protein